MGQQLQYANGYLQADPLGGTQQGQAQQIAGTVVTKTTVEKMFVPSDPSLAPVTLGGNGQVAPEPVAVPAFAGSVAVRPGAQAVNQVITEPVAMTAFAGSMAVRPAQQVKVANGYPRAVPSDRMISRAAPSVQRPPDGAVMARLVPMQVQQAEPLVVPAISGSEFVNVGQQLQIANGYRQADPLGGTRGRGVVPSRSHAPAYQIDGRQDYMDNYEGEYQNDGQGFVEQGYDGAGMYQIEDQANEYAPQYYEDQYSIDQQFQDQQFRDQQFNDQQFADQQFDEQQALQQQYSDDGHVDYLDGPQGDMQYQQFNDQQYSPQGDFAQYEAGADVAAGIARPQDEKPEDGAGEDQFTRLLNSLEARVDLMAQMQHTRAEIQKHTKTLQSPTKVANSSRMLEDGFAPQRRQMALPSTQKEAPVLQLEPERPFSNMVEDLGNAGSSMPHERESGGLFGSPGSRLVEENNRLRNEFEDQKHAIDRLTSTVTGMKSELRTLSVEPQQRTVLDRSVLGSQDRTRTPDDRFTYENQRSGVQQAADDGRGGEEVESLQVALQQERSRHDSTAQQWTRERRQLLEELSMLKANGGSGRRALSNLPTVGEGGESDYGSLSLLQTAAVLPANGLMQFAGFGRAAVEPLSRNPCGMNIELSEDGYTAKRVRGCRQSVVLGSAPLQPQELGHYFEVVVRETVNGWVGGLGIGVTRVPPAELKRMPDKAWRIPNTFIVGYWGCLFLDGREKRTKWKADTLTVGSRVGLLVTGDGRGDLIVFVDGVPVVRAEDVLPTSGLHSEELYPIIDVFAATLAVELQQNAVAPAKPWSNVPSPPGSPASTARNIVNSSMDLTQQLKR